MEWAVRGRYHQSYHVVLRVHAAVLKYYKLHCECPVFSRWSCLSSIGSVPTDFRWSGLEQTLWEDSQGKILRLVYLCGGVIIRIHGADIIFVSVRSCFDILDWDGQTLIFFSTLIIMVCSYQERNYYIIFKEFTRV